jgi:hypothetical protein
MKTFTVTLAFLLLTALPCVGRAEEPNRNKKADQATDIQSCLSMIEKQWFSGKSPSQSLKLVGSTRYETSCEMTLHLSPDALQVSALGAQHAIDFDFAESSQHETQILQTCRVDKEKLHIVFEEKTSDNFEKRERVQMTLLKRHGKGISLILSKRENKILRPLQQNSLICHLD